MRTGFTTTEFWKGIGALAAIYGAMQEAVQAAVENPESAMGIGIAVAGGSMALAYLAGKYGMNRTEAKKNGGSE